MASTNSPVEAIEKLLDLQVPAAPKLSSDGSRVAYHTSFMKSYKKGKDNAVASIWVAEVGKARSSRQLTSGLFNDKNPQWCGDSVIFTSDRKEAGKKTGIYQLSLTGGEPVFLSGNHEYEKGISKFAVSPDGKLVAFTKACEDTAERKARTEAKDDAHVFGEDYELDCLYVLHLHSRSVETLVSGALHVGAFAWSPDSLRIAYDVVKTPEVEAAITDGAELRIVDVATSKSQLVKHYQREPWNGLQWIDDKIYSVVTAKPGVANTSTVIASIDPKGGDWNIELGSDSFCARQMSAHGSMAVVYCQNDLEDELRSIDGEVLYSRFGMIDGFDGINKGSDGPVLTFLGSTINKPVEVFSVSTSDKEPIQLSSHGDSVTEPVAHAIRIHTRSADGEVELDGFLYIPVQSVPSDWDGKPLTTPLPTYIEPHGGPYDRRTQAFFHGFAWNQLLLRQGYAYFGPNYRGGAGHGADFAGPFPAGMHDWNDTLALTAHLVSAGWADKDRLILGGWSQGGYLAYLCAVRNGTGPGSLRFRGCIAGAGVCDWDSMTLAADIPYMEAEIAGFQTPWEQEDKHDTRCRGGSALWEFAPAAREGRVPPMLLVHGEADIRIPVSQAWAFQRACRKWRVPCQMVTYPREMHNFNERRHIVDMSERVSKFCDLHFK